jgi:hypothetical protein
MNEETPDRTGANTTSSLMICSPFQYVLFSVYLTWQAILEGVLSWLVNYGKDSVDLTGGAECVL